MLWQLLGERKILLPSAKKNARASPKVSENLKFLAFFLLPYLLLSTRVLAAPSATS
ncbi:hypothetical protein NIES4071_18550 [Calothrix sp. NIES-4071]|nr:hypothetical protein NIES4071_18550 [Calothrix sp. NIES-4071]BAZ56188.1 hypothetical protein NIES4105_18500 [Calothrix sp. NIES-4105]